uniref:Telomere-associated protein Rif1 N-terminal domain-containing protein n=1 Tax=Glossina brevipalpis TaxID=37001 RepID=A0A1A9WI75_9MUSC
MESEMSEAYYGVYCSSKEILKNNQRHLYCNMLDLLTSTCKATGLVGGKKANDEMFNFWINDILPLTFDTDRAIQSKAVESLEQGIISLDIQAMHKSKQWPTLKAFLTSESSKIHKLLENRNSHWYRVWSFFIRLLDRELSKKASTINTFLAIVELGFRNSDNNVRVESFQCWRLLIEIFAKYKEISSPKRLKLICIPLKSSQSKSALGAEVKFRVWWYLLTCLDNDLAKHFEVCVEPFLTFCFGNNSSSLETSVCTAQQYELVKEMALICLAKLLSCDKNETLERCLRDKKLENLSVPSPLLESEILEKRWQPLVYSAFQGLRLIALEDQQNIDQDLGKQLIYQQLLRQLMLMTLSKDIASLTVYVANALVTMINDSPRLVGYAMNMLATEGLHMQKTIANMEMYGNVTKAFACLFIKIQIIIPPAILESCVERIFNLEFHKSGIQNWRILNSHLENIFCCQNDEEDYQAFEVKLLMWQKVSHGLMQYLKDNNLLDLRVKENANTLERWLLWPLQLSVGFAGIRSKNSFDHSFCVMWCQLLYTGQNSSERAEFLSQLKNNLKELLITQNETIAFGEFLDAYVTTILTLENTSHRQEKLKEFLDLMQELLKQYQQPQKMPKEALKDGLNTFSKALTKFKNEDIVDLFESLREIAISVKRFNDKDIETSFLEDWKKMILDKLRQHPVKELFSQMKDALKSNNIFVVIPSVWSLNPDKLTERQKERIAEKQAIPALYNDMSQSQDTSLKPWTPKKIVIAQKDKSEIILQSPETKKHEKEEKEQDNKDNGARNSPKLKQLEEAEKYNTRNSSKRQEVLKKIEEETKDKVTTVTEDNNQPKRIQTRRNSLRSKVDLKKPEEKLKTSPMPVEKIHSKENKSSVPNKITEVLTTTTVLPESEDLFKESETIEEQVNLKDNGISESETHVNTADLIVNLIEESPPQRMEDEEIVDLTNVDSEILSLNTVVSKNSPNALHINENREDDVIESPENSGTLQQHKKIQPLNESIQQPKEISPKKVTPNSKLTRLSSPPGRKLINNSTSPTLKPKPPSHLTGRGAQLINMIRQKILETNSNQSATVASTAQQQQQCNAHAELMELTYTENTSTPVRPKDLLVFSKRLPSPTASPSVSILKRKLHHDTLDDVTSYDSPATKRKRVSFHDPPVSVTKEYIRDVEENKTKPKRCLVMDKNNILPSPLEIKYVLRRRSKLDSLAEIEKYPHSIIEGNHNNERSPTKRRTSTDIDMVTENALESLKWNDSANTSTNNENPPAGTSSTSNINFDSNMTDVSVQDQQCTSHDLSELNLENALKIVTEQCSLDTILEKYFNLENPPQLKFTNSVSKFLSNVMTTHTKIKSDVLETFSENHSKDFLDHAVQENLSTVVCDRLNLNSVIEYVCAKSQINTNCRNTLLEQLPHVLKNCKNDEERVGHIKNFLGQCQFSDEQILDLISMLLRFRNNNKTSTDTTQMTMVSLVSESAVDSSSNL